MNIPDDAFYTLLRQALDRRKTHTRQRALYYALREAILDGRLQPHSRLPGSRTVAGALKVSRNTVNAALEQLAIEGYLTRNRQGTAVSPLPSSPVCVTQACPPVTLAARLRHLPAGSRRDSPALWLTPGLPATNYFPLSLWRRLLDKVLRTEGSVLLGYGDPAGEPRLRKAIARHLALSRGIQCDASQIVITEGSLEGVGLCTHLLSQAGEVAWVEEPGYPGAKSVFIAAGLRVIGVSVDGEGLAVNTLSPDIPSLIFTSPSHQYPLGQVMSVSRRLALLEFAQQQGAWIIEDDYDSEFRYSGEPVPAMLGMRENAPVVYLGTFSKTLFPSLRIGFMVLPPALAGALEPAIASLLRGGHRAEQLALAHFIEEGHYARHLAAMRRLYRKRQAALREALASELTFPHQVYGGEGGLHLTLTLENVDDVMLAEQARRYHLAPGALSRLYLKPANALRGLVLGYGNTSASHYPNAIRTLNRLIAPIQHGRE
ncbi:DNA-binding protein [Superficieibacter electus]|uniref:DNA-binding protein n=1 Tax=Superficieibacter electus TaxID=2022662 RepID=A0A2P5GSK1_9ENTR|nr:PLP-dependent aminotransferase family protein [Superficieibacter electus]POP46806.1 DNA-binding protein [Superficieibacter electus]POP49544.1 DNA-binding protein [Superficieibacter electus]